jgi:hypothetical protein
MPPHGINPTQKAPRRFGSIDGRPVGKSALAPPRLFAMRNGVHLQPGRAVLVRRGGCPPADACRWRGLPVPRLSAPGGGGKRCARSNILKMPYPEDAFAAISRSQAAIEARIKTAGHLLI